MERVKYNKVEVSHGNIAKKFPVYEIYLDESVQIFVHPKKERGL